MIAYLSGVVSESAIGRSFAKLRHGPLRTLPSLLDWVIPPALVVVIAVASAWMAFATK